MTFNQIMNLSGMSVCGYTMTRVLGQGQYGTVYHATSGAHEIAVKLSTDQQEHINEVKCLQHLAHTQNVVPRFYFSIGDEQLKVMGLELCGLNLLSLLKTTPNGRFDPDIVQKIGYHTIGCLHVLHQYGIAHRDIKLENFVLAQSDLHGRSTIRVIDSGCARLMENDDRADINFRAMQHASPEVMIANRPTRKDDLIQWSYAILHASGFDVVEVFNMVTEELFMWKKQLLSNPSSILINEFRWMTPMFEEIAEFKCDSDYNYTGIKFCIRESIPHTTPEEPFTFIIVDGMLMLQ